MDNLNSINTSFNKNPWRSITSIDWWSKLHLDIPLFSLLFGLFALGLLILYSAKPEIQMIQKQVFRVGIAFCMLLITAQISPRIYKSWTIWLYYFSLITLILVLVMGNVSKGAQRWLDLGFLRFQPAEIMKIAVPLMVARSLDARILPPSFTSLIMPTLYIVVPVILIAMQPDLGTAILIASSGMFVIFFSGIHWKIIISLAITGLCSAPVMWMLLRSYQKERILTLLDPEKDPLGSGYHIIQSKIALGSGGLYGKGWLNGTQSHLEFLPERTTDFIFAVFGEEFGFIGVILLLVIYTLIIFRGLYIGTKAQDTFSRLLSGSLVMTFFVYIFVNIGMVSGILPVVGIPLPLVSYGGTSLVTLMIGFGMLMSIHANQSLVRK